MEGSTYESVLAEMKALKDEVHHDVDAILGGGISGGVTFGASAMDEVSNVDIYGELYKLSAQQLKLADQVAEGFKALHARLDKIQASPK